MKIIIGAEINDKITHKKTVHMCTENLDRRQFTAKCKQLFNFTT